MEKGIVVINNMHTQADANKVIEAIEHVWGLGQVEVNLSKKEAVFTYDERMAQSSDFEQAIIDTGFEVS